MCEKGRQTTKGRATDSVLASVDCEQSTERVHEVEAAVAEQPGHRRDHRGSFSQSRDGLPISWSFGHVFEIHLVRPSFRIDGLLEMLTRMRRRRASSITKREGEMPSFQSFASQRSRELERPWRVRG